MGFEVIQDEDLTWPQLRDEHLTENGKKDRAIREAFDGHGGDQTLKTQCPQHGDMAPPIDRLGGLGSLAPGSAGVETGHRLMAASFIEKDAVFRGEECDDGVERGPLLLDVWPPWLGGATRFFCGEGPVWSTPG